MVEVRTFRVADGLVVVVRGELDAALAAEVAEQATGQDGGLVVDLLRAKFVDLDVVDAFVAALPTDTRFVAERTMLEALRVVGLHRPVAVEPSLLAALA